MLSFQKLKTEVYDTQLAFSMLAQYGEEAIEPLSTIDTFNHLLTVRYVWP